MDKIQSALAKARAEREALKSAVTAAETPPPTEQKTSEVASEPSRLSPQTDLDAWRALDELAVEPKLIEQNRIVALQDGAPGAEFDMMRTRVLQQMRANNWRWAVVAPATRKMQKT